LVAASFLASGTANADPMSNTDVAWWTFTTYWAPTDIRTSISPFTFSGISGEIVSVAYYSTGGPTEGRWVYAYQIKLKSWSGEGTIIGFYAPTFAPPAINVAGISGYFSFQTSKPSFVWPDAFPILASGGVRPTASDYYPSTVPSTVSWNISLNPPINVNTVVFGYVSNAPPTFKSATLQIDGVRYTGPMVQVASPEPASALLLGIGLLGIGMFRRRKR
jgi:hypothetical protein